MADLEARLARIVRGTPWLMEALAVVRELGPPGAYLAAGAVRDTVWNVLSGQPAEPTGGDLDVVFFAGADEGADYEARLARRLPQYTWEVVDQASVHRWHAQQGRTLPPHRNLQEGLASWPETATAVGVRLSAFDALDVIAPLGLEDLFALVARHNPVAADAQVFARRVRDKRWRQRWPTLRVLPARSPAPAPG